MAVEGWGFLLPAQHRLSMLSVQPVCTAYLSSLSAQPIGTAYLSSLSAQPRAQLFAKPVCPAYLHSLSLHSTEEDAFLQSSQAERCLLQRGDIKKEGKLVLI